MTETELETILRLAGQPLTEGKAFDTVSPATDDLINEMADFAERSVLDDDPMVRKQCREHLASLCTEYNILALIKRIRG